MVVEGAVGGVVASVVPEGAGPVAGVVGAVVGVVADVLGLIGSAELCVNINVKKVTVSKRSTTAKAVTIRYRTFFDLRINQ